MAEVSLVALSCRMNGFIAFSRFIFRFIDSLEGIFRIILLFPSKPDRVEATEAKSEPEKPGAKLCGETGLAEAATADVSGPAEASGAEAGESAPELNMDDASCFIFSA